MSAVTIRESSQAEAIETRSGKIINPVWTAKGSGNLQLSPSTVWSNKGTEISYRSSSFSMRRAPSKPDNTNPSPIAPMKSTKTANTKVARKTKAAWRVTRWIRRMNFHSMTAKLITMTTAPRTAKGIRPIKSSEPGMTTRASRNRAAVSPETGVRKCW